MGLVLKLGRDKSVSCMNKNFVHACLLKIYEPLKIRHICTKNIQKVDIDDVIKYNCSRQSYRVVTHEQMFLKERLVKTDKPSLASIKLFSEQVRAAAIALYKELSRFISRITVRIGFNVTQKNLTLALDILLWQEKSSVQWHLYQMFYLACRKPINFFLSFNMLSTYGLTFQVGDLRGVF